MSAYIEQAARVTDPVKHSDLDFRLGLAIVALVGGGVAILLAAPSGGASVAIMLTAASGADLVGSAIDEANFAAAARERHIDREGDELIIAGAATVFMDEIRENAAKAHPATELEHTGHWVTHGSKTVLIEDAYASRLGDFTSCGGYISYGSETVFTGGEMVNHPAAAPHPHEVHPSFYDEYQSFLLVAGLISAAAAARALALRAGAPARTGTVWDDITPTQPVYEGTVIPRSFELQTPSGRVWVGGNGTKHIMERVTGRLNQATPTFHPTLATQQMAAQQQLRSLQQAVDRAMRHGPVYDEMYNVLGWELKIGSGNNGHLPAIYHALLR